MTADQLELCRTIEAFDIDGGPCDMPFAARLARENGWSRSFAERAVREYKRFVFLAMTSDTPVCPSEGVDAAWHLHLTYTKSYWKRFDLMRIWALSSGLALAMVGGGALPGKPER